jgi:signal transduction histidine kinase/ligand-binding sensor domain-containing protein
MKHCPSTTELGANRLRLSLPCLFLFFSAWGQGTTLLEALHYGMDEGLSHREAHVVFEDAEGFIWVGTKDGLNQFDGERFKHFKQHGSGFSFNDISRIAQDDQGWLWLWNNEGFAFFDPKTYKVATFRQRFGAEFPPFEWKLLKEGSWKLWDIRQVATDSEGRLYLDSAQENEFITYHSSEGFVRHALPSKIPMKVRAIDNGKHLYLSSMDAFFEYTTHEKKIRLLKKISGARFEEMLVLDGKVRPKFLVPILPKGLDDHFRHFGDHIVCYGRNSVFFNHKLGNLWSFDAKTWRVSDWSGKLVASLPKKSTHPPEMFNFINYFFSDSKGKVWLATDAGLTLLQLKEQVFKSYFKKEDGFPYHSSVRGMVKEGHYLYANLEMGGFFRLDEGSGKWELLDQSLENKGAQTGERMTDYWGRALFRSRDGTFWIGGRQELRAYDLHTGKMTHYFEQGRTANDTHDLDIWDILEDASGTLWLGTGNGLYFKKKQSDYFSPIAASPAFPEFREAVVLFIYQADGRILYLCTNQGLYFFDTHTRQLTRRLWPGGEGDNFLPEKDIQHLHKDRDGTYWLASANGLLHWDMQGRRHEVFDQRHGLPNNKVYGILEDAGGSLWFGTDRGLVRFNKASRQAEVFNKASGLPYDEFNRIAFLKTPDGNFYFGGMNGIVGFDPSTLPRRNAKDYKMQVTAIHVFDYESNQLNDITPEYWKNGKIAMSDRNGFMSLSFSILDYGQNANKHFQYTIDEGGGQYWMDLYEPEVKLNKLPYGAYKLKIKCFADNLGEGTNMLVVPIEVPKPFYLKAWFYLFLGLLVVGGVVAYFRGKVRRQKKTERYLQSRIQEASSQLEEKYALIAEQKIELEKLNLIKDQIFTIIGHDLRKPATVFQNMGKKISYLLKREDFIRLEQLCKSIERDAASVTLLTENLLNWAMSEKKTLAPHFVEVEVEALLKDVVASLMPLAEIKNIRLRYELPGGLQLVADRNSLHTALLNLVDNAIKFTPEEGEVAISVAAADGQARIEITDTGVGIPPDKLERIFLLSPEKNTKGTVGEKGAGLGLHLVEEFVRMNKGQIEVRSVVGKGTTFVLTLPL